MQAGKLRHRVTIRRPASPTNNGGTPMPGSPTALYSRIAAHVLNASAAQMERVFGSQVQATASHQVLVRYVPSIKVTDEIVWHDGETDRVLRIVGQHADERKRDLAFAVTEHIS